MLVGLLACSQASADKIGDAYSNTGSGGTGCTYGGTLIQSVSPSNHYAAPYDGVITSWTNEGDYWPTMKFEVARLGSSGTYTVIATDGPRTASQRTTFPVRLPVRQGDVIGANVPTGNYTICPSSGGGGYSTGIDDSDLPPGGNGYFDSYASYKAPIEAQIERDGDGDGFGDESQDACPSNASTQGPCPLPTVLGRTFTPDPGTTAGSGERVVTNQVGFPVAAQQDGVITSWSYQAGPNVEGTLRLKMFRPLGGDDYRVVGSDQLRNPSADALNTYPVRIPVREGDKIGVNKSGVPVASNVSAPEESFATLSGADLADGSSASFTRGNGRRIDLSAVLEADADGDGFGDTSQDLCPTDPSTQGQCPTLLPPPTILDPPADEDPACAKAERKLKKLKAKLAKLKKKDDVAAKKAKAAKAKVKKAKKAVKKAC